MGADVTVGQARTPSARERVVVAAVFIGLAIVGALTIVPRVSGWNDGSRMAMIESLVDWHSLSIDHSSFVDVVGDKVLVNGHYYSDKLATPQLVGALVYAPLSGMGIKLHLGWNLAYYLITLLTVKLFWLLGLVAFFKALGFTGLTIGRRLWVTVALGVGTLVFSWTALFNNHSLAASWVAIAFFFLLRAKNGGPVGTNLFLSGLFFGLAGSSDVPTMAFPVAFALHIVLDPRLRRATWVYVLGLVLAISPAMAVNYAISGSFVPVQVVPAYFLWPGSPWTAETLSGTGVNSGSFLASYTFDVLLGERGFLLYNPFSFLVLPLMVREFAQRLRFASEALLVFLMSLVIVAYYCLATNNFGGDSYSIRWFVPMLPLWMFFLHPLLLGSERWRWAVFCVLLAVSFPVALVGTWNPFNYLNEGQVPFFANIDFAASTLRELLSGS